MELEMRTGYMTPWGKSDNVEQIAEGVYFVETPSHGGIMVDSNSHFAIDELSGYAWDEAYRYADWLCFEEDAAWAIAMYELIHSDTPFCNPSYEEDPERYENIVEEILSTYYSSYYDKKNIASL